MKVTTRNTGAPKQTRWGRWWLDRRQPPSINIRLTPWYVYEIMLDTCRSEARRRHWLRHMASKRFITARDILNLRRAFEHLLEAEIIQEHDYSADYR